MVRKKYGYNDHTMALHGIMTPVIESLVMSEVNLKNHPFLTTAPEMQTLCLPLFSLGINHFVYHKNYLNGGEIRLSNNPRWLQHFYDGQYHRFSAFEKNPKELQTGYVIWAHLQNHNTVLDAAREFNIDHGISLVKRVTDGVEYFFFGTTRDNPQIINFYINNLQLLERFTVYFKERGAELIKKANSKKIIIPNKFHVAAKIDDEGNPCLVKNHQLEKFISQTHLKKIHITDQLNISLSRRELDCIAELVQGKTMKEIGNHLGISARTVETHVNHLKEKLQCRTKSELLRYLNQHGFNNKIAYF